MTDLNTQIFAITFGSGQYGGLFTNKFARVEAHSEMSAREQLYKLIGNHYAFIYPMDRKFDEQIVKFGLTEVPFIQVKDLYDWAKRMVKIHATAVELADSD